MKCLKATSLVLVSLFLVAGCSTSPKAGFNLQTRKITIITEPEGASVLQMNLPGGPSTNLGITPIENQSVTVVSEITELKNMPYNKTEALMKRVGNIVVNIKKDGYRTYVGTLNVEEGQTVVHRITLIRE